MQLIYIHGTGGCKESWINQVQHFEGSDAINLPGHPDGDPCQTIEEAVDWLRGYVAEKGYQDLVLVGHSLGGGIALQYALDSPDQLKGVVLIGSGARLRVHPQFLEMLEKAVNEGTPIDFGSGDTESLIKPELAEIIDKRREENGAATSLADMRACDQFDVMERVGTLKVPLLAVVGDKDVMTPPKYSHYMVEKMPDARAVIIPGATHMVYAEFPDETNQAIEQFLNGL